MSVKNPSQQENRAEPPSASLFPSLSYWLGVNLLLYGLAFYTWAIFFEVSANFILLSLIFITIGTIQVGQFWGNVFAFFEQHKLLGSWILLNLIFFDVWIMALGIIIGHQLAPYFHQFINWLKPAPKQIGQDHQLEQIESSSLKGDDLSSSSPFLQFSQATEEKPNEETKRNGNSVNLSKRKAYLI